MAYSTVQGVYRFDTDGDWFTFSGKIDSYDGGGALKNNVWYAPEQLGLDTWNDHNPNDLIKFDSVSNHFGYGYSDLEIESYHDTNSGLTFNDLYNGYNNGFNNLSAELKAEGLIYEVGPEENTFNINSPHSSGSSANDPIEWNNNYFREGNGSSGGVTTIINIINNGQGNITVGDINVNSLKGTASADALSGRSGNDFENDVIDGMGGNDVLTGYRGADQLNGGVGNDEVRAGNGKDILTGGEGMDELYGGFGMNTFTGEQDGYADDLYLKSDHLAVNWLTNTANNNLNGYKTDEIGALDSYDKIHIQGAMDSQLSFMDTSHVRGDGTELDGIGIYASGSLEAVYTGGNLSVQQVMSMTSGVAA